MYESHKETEHLRYEFDKEVMQLNFGLKNSIAKHLTVLRSVKNFYLSSDSVERDEFKSFVEPILKDFQGIQAIEWSPIIPLSQRQYFEKTVKKEGFSEFEITERDTHNNFIRANNREYFVPVTFIEPLKGNDFAFGYDLNSNASRHEALEIAKKSGEIATTAKVTLVQDDQVGVLSFIAIYKKNVLNNSEEERNKNILGYVLAVFHIQNLFDTVKNEDYKRLHVQLFDENATTDEQYLLFSNKNLSPSSPFILHEKGLFGRNISLVNSSFIRVGNRQWRFEISATQDYFAFYHSDNLWLILLAGFILTSLVCVFVMVSTGREMVLQQLVHERTKELIKTQKELKNSNLELEQLASTDSLTGLFNRRVFLERLTQESDRILRLGGFSSLLMFDLDFFKHINDTYGHATGDEVLKQFSALLKEYSRNIDVPARLGGEEFVILLSGTSQEDALKMAERFRKQVARMRIKHALCDVSITVSIGAALLSENFSKGETVLAHADAALYKAKKLGRNQTCWFSYQKFD